MSQNGKKIEKNIKKPPKKQNMWQNCHKTLTVSKNRQKPPKVSEKQKKFCKTVKNGRNILKTVEKYSKTR